MSKAETCGYEESFSFRSINSWEIKGRLWRCSKNARGSVIGSHGYSEHSGRYQEFAQFWNRNGFHFAMLDLPGHGFSDGRRSNIDQFSDYVFVFEDFFRTLKSFLVEAPYIGFGHSLGGLILIRFLQTSDVSKEFSSLVLSSPLLGLSPKAFRGTGAIAQSMLGRLFLLGLTQLSPNIELPNRKDLGGSNLSHDQSKMDERRRDPLIRPKVTTHWTREFLKAREDAFQEVDHLTQPTGFFEAGDDRVVSTPQATEFFNRLKNPKNQIITYPGLFHEILNEIERDRVMADMLAFVENTIVKSGV